MYLNRLSRLLPAALLFAASCASDPAVDGYDDEELDSQEQVVMGTEQAVALPAVFVDASGDTTLHSGFPYNNDGNSATLGLTAISVSDQQRILIKFDQAAINLKKPSGKVLHSARIDLQLTGISAGWLGHGMDILRMTKPWVEGNGLGNGASWVCANDTNTSVFGNLTNDCPVPGDNWSIQPGGPFPQPFNSVASGRTSLFTNGLTTVSFDVTNDVQAFFNGTTNNGWMIAGSPNLVGGQTVGFGSKSNSDTAKRPKLWLVFGDDDCPLDPNKGTPGVCGCGVPDRDTNFDGAPDCFDAVIPATADATMKLVNPFGTYGKDPFVVATSASIANLERGLIKVDSSAINTARAGRGVKKAYLELTVAGIAVGWAGGQLGLNRMKQWWDEGNGTAGHGVSWVCADDFNTTSFNFQNDCLPKDNWSMPVFGTAGGPYETTPTGVTGVVWPGMSTVRFDVTSDVQAYLNDPMGVLTPNHGWLLQGVPSTWLSGNWVNFASRETSAPPKLLLDFDEECPFGTGGDKDGDGVANCRDECATDPGKSKPGLCGCGKPDTDTDGDGLANCIDACPLDGDPTLGGDCGCPSGTGANAAVVAGTLCLGPCAGSGTGSPFDKCDGVGHCGNPAVCDGPVPGGICDPAVTTEDIIWTCETTTDQNTARTFCENTPGQKLAMVTNDAYNEWVRRHIKGDSWIAGNDSHFDGEWRLVYQTGAQFWSGGPNGTPYYGRYSNWATSEPNNTDPAKDCAAMSKTTGKWSARNCVTEQLKVACVRSRKSAPDPKFTGSGNGTGANGGGGSDQWDWSGCEVTGTCGDGNSAADCVDPHSVVANCDAVNETDPLTCAGADATALNDCDACMRNNTDVCKEGGNPSACETRCQGQCSDALDFVPDANSRCTDMVAFQGNLECAVTDATLSSPLCTNDASCAAGKVCGSAFYCTEDGVNRLGVCSISQDPGVTIADPCPGPGDCMRFDVCGTKNPTCADTDFGAATLRCREFDLCVEPENDIVVADPPPSVIADLLDPDEFDPKAPGNFDPPQLPTTDLINPWEDPWCWPGDTCTGPNAPKPEDTRFCKYEVKEKLKPQDAGQTKSVGAGPGDKLTFDFDPTFSLKYDVKTGPLGLPLGTVEAEASLKASTVIKAFKNIEYENTILDVGVTGKMGLEIGDLRPDDATNTEWYDPATDLCGFSSTSRAKILGISLVPAGYDQGVKYPEDDKQRECVETVQKIVESVDRVRKAYVDARELILQYNHFKKAGRTFGGVNGSLCQQIAASVPGDFPKSTDCANEPPETTINRFVFYYDFVVIAQLRAVVDSFADKLNIPFEPKDLGQEPQQEDVTIFNQTFMVGPVPVNVEVMMPITYGFKIVLTPKIALGQLIKALALPLPPGETAKTGSDPFASLNLSVGPRAGASITLFAGIGFDCPLAGAKFGFEGGISLGDIAVPVHGEAGIAAGVVPDDRNIHPDFNDLLFSKTELAQPLVPKQKVAFSLTYDYGVDLEIKNVLNGFLNGIVKVHFFWFGFTYRARLLTFKGLCSQPYGDHERSLHPGEPNDSFRKDWCDVPLFSSGANPMFEWGTIQMPMLFQVMKPVEFPPTGVVLNKVESFMPGVWLDTAGKAHGGVGEVFYDSQCQCLPQWDYTEDAYNNPKQCTRNEDCCGHDASIPSVCVPGTGNATGRMICEAQII